MIHIFMTAADLSHFVTVIAGQCHGSGSLSLAPNKGGWVQFQASLCWIRGGQSGSVTCFSPTLVFACQYHSTNTPYSYFIYQQHYIILANDSIIK